MTAICFDVMILVGHGPGLQLELAASGLTPCVVLLCWILGPQTLDKQPPADSHLCHPCVQAIAAKCPLSFTGADMYALCADAWMAGLKRVIAEGPDVSPAACLAVKVGSAQVTRL